MAYSPTYNDNTQLYSNTLAVVGPISALDTTGYASVVIQISGTWSGNILVEGSSDGSIWQELLGMSLSEISIQDIITENGTYLFKATTKYIRLNVLQLQIGTISALILGRIGAGTSAVDSLSLAMDRSNNTPLYVTEIETKKDVSRALIPSDAPTPIYGSIAGIIMSTVIDTTGYQSMTTQIYGTWSGNLVFEQSNDGVTYNTSSFMVINTAPTVVTALSSNNLVIMPCLCKYIRIRLTVYTSGVVQTISFLRQSPVPYTPISALPSNISQINSTPIVSAGLAGVVSVGGTQVAGGSVNATYPVVIGGVDPTAFIRRILTDTGGRIIAALTDQGGTARSIGGLSPASNAQNIASLAVTDISQYEGQSQIEILAQMLMEIRIGNKLLRDISTSIVTTETLEELRAIQSTYKL